MSWIEGGRRLKGIQINEYKQTFKQYEMNKKYKKN